MVIYGLYMNIFLEGKPPNIWSYTVYICTFFWKGSHQIYAHIRCIYVHFVGREATKYMVIYSVYTNGLANPKHLVMRADTNAWRI